MAKKIRRPKKTTTPNRFSIVLPDGNAKWIRKKAKKVPAWKVVDDAVGHFRKCRKTV